MREGVAELVHDDVVGTDVVALEELRGAADLAAGRQARDVDRVLPVKDVDHVTRPQQVQDVGGVVGDPGRGGWQR
jgi:hypothetical protein